MIFMEDKYERSLEKLMTEVPNFKRRFSGIRVIEYSKNTCDCKLCPYHKGKQCKLPICPFVEERMTAGLVKRYEIVQKALENIKKPSFVRRFENYITESRKKDMVYRNEKHEQIFNEAIQKMDKNNYGLMSAIYLLTADLSLWNKVKYHIEKNCIFFEKINRKSFTEMSYTLFCTSMDLCRGTKHITVSDLSDTKLISPVLFTLICNAMAIRRYGLIAVNAETKEN